MSLQDSKGNDKSDQMEMQEATRHIESTDEIAINVTTSASFEQNMTIIEALRSYPKAVLYSFGICLAIIMEGYDTGLLTSFYGLEQFRRAYGSQLPDGDWQFAPAMQSLTGSVSSLGSIFGVLFAGWMTNRVGYRWTMLLALSIISAGIFITFFSRNIQMLIIGQVVCGFPLGMFQGMSSSYAADIAPLRLRAILTSYINLCWGLGQFISNGVLRTMLSRQDQWAYRIPFAVQWAWPIPIAIIVLLAPESPWWLIRNNQMDRAHKVLRSLASNRVSGETVNSNFQLMCATNEMEKSNCEGTSYLDLFRGTNLRRTEIACCTWICQVTCGTWFGSNIIYFMEQAGLDASVSFSFGLGVNAVSCACTIASWTITAYVGRRTLYLQGLLWMLITELIVGFIYINPPSGGGYIAGAFLVLNTVAYFLTIGPVCYVIVPEVPSVRLRIKTVAVARMWYSAFALMAGFLNPYVLNPSAWNLQGKGGFVWGAFCLVSLVWAYFRLPELKDRTPAEIDILFSKHISARQFSKEEVDISGHMAATIHSPHGEKSDEKL